MKTCVFTPSHETGILVADIIPDAGSHDTRLGRESSWPQAPSGIHFFRPLMVKGIFCALTGRAAFLFRGNVNNLYLGKHIPIAGVGHQAGTCRFGTDPATSVLDINCKAHELDNLYVVDTSFFPSIGAVNPSLTAMANALRVGDHVLKRLG